MEMMVQEKLFNQKRNYYGFVVSKLLAYVFTENKDGSSLSAEIECKRDSDDENFECKVADDLTEGVKELRGWYQVFKCNHNNNDIELNCRTDAQYIYPATPGETIKENLLSCKECLRLSSDESSDEWKS
jgi:hypothetical protein